MAAAEPAGPPPAMIKSDMTNSIHYRKINDCEAERAGGVVLFPPEERGEIRPVVVFEHLARIDRLWFCRQGRLFLLLALYLYGLVIGGGWRGGGVVFFFWGFW